MARGNFYQSSFLGGEISALAQGLSQSEGYSVSLAVALNYIPSDEGALLRRSGTRLSAYAAADDVRLIEFVSESSDALLIEATAGKFRFHARGTLLTDQAPKEVLSVSTATPAVVTTDTAHGYTTGDTVVFRQLNDSAAPPYRNAQYAVTVLTATTFSIAHAGPLSGPVNGATLSLPPLAEVDRVTERASPYTTADLPGIMYSEESDTLYLFHPGYVPYTIARAGLVVSAAVFVDGPYLDENTTAVTLTFSGTSGSVNVTASSTSAINGGQGWLATDVGRTIRVNTGTATAPFWTWLRITARTSATVAVATVSGSNLTSASANTKWQLGAYSDSTGWPTHGVIHEGRLWLVSQYYPGRIDGSVTFSMFEFSPTEEDGTVADDNGVTAIFAGSGRQGGRWLQPVDSGLLIGTDGGEYIVRASSYDDPITPFSLQVRRQTDFGAAAVMPRRVGKNSIFVQSLGRALFEYRGTQGGFDGNDLARAARHLTAKGMVETAVAGVPVPLVWALRGDGRVVGTVYRDDAQGRQNGWHRYSFEWAADVAAGEDAQDRYLRGGEARSKGSVKSIASAPFSDPSETRNDLLWIAIDRNGTTCIEYMSPVFDATFLQNEGLYSDSGVAYRQEDLGFTWRQTGTNQYTFYGLDHLNGDSVDVQFRGADLGEFTVTGGAITIPVAPELSSAAATEDFTSVTQAIGGTLAENSGYVSQLTGATVTLKGHNPAGAFAKGEDGKRYYVARNNSGGGAPFGIYIIDADTGTLADSVDETTILADVAADLVEPPGGWVGGSPGAGDFAWVFPDTPYVAAKLEDNFGVSINKGMAIYKIDNTGSLVYVGGWAEDPTSTAFQEVMDSEYGDAPARERGQGVFAGLGVANSFVLFTTYRESKSLIFSVPGPADVAVNSPINLLAAENLEARSLNVTALAPAFDQMFRNTDATELPFPGAAGGFFLPGPNGLTYLFCYIPRELMVQHAAGTASRTVPALTAQSAISTDPVLVQFTLAASSFSSMRLVSANVLGGDRFEGFPFPDIGENFAGGAGTSPLNDYGDASVTPSDLNDYTKPWYVFFPRRYPDGADNTDKLGIRAYLWDPKGGPDGAGYGTFLGFDKGRLYDVTADSIVSTQTVSGDLSIFWERADNTLYVMTYGNGSPGSNTIVVSEFGSFVPENGTVNIVDPQYLDAFIGLNSQARAQLLRPDIGSGAQVGPALGKTRRVDQGAVLLSRTSRMWSGATFDTADAQLAPAEMVFRDPDAFGRRPLYSGVFQYRLPSSYDFDNMITLEQRRPGPGAIVAFNGFSTAQDR